MSRRKLKKYTELETFENCLQNPDGIKGNWKEQHFRNANPIVLELGCGKGEYAINLAEKVKEKNFIGVDVKGSRLWNGARIALQKNLKNVTFLRIQINFILEYFAENEVSEIWIPFPDPFPREKNRNKRLTSPWFIEKYKHILNKEGMVHFKTDSNDLFHYTLNILKDCDAEIINATSNLYASGMLNDVLSIRTTYEQIFLETGSTIKYINFKFADG